MSSSVGWQLYYSASGNPSFGQVVDSGSLGPLGAGQCVNLNYPPTSSGSYAYRVEQESGGSGPSIVWSNSCMVSGDCYPSPATSTPFLPDTATPTAPAVELTLTPTGEPTDEGTPTPTNTAPAVEVTLTPTIIGTGEGPLPPTATATTATATVPAVPTSTATTQSTPLPFNLSFVCGYAGDDYLLWRVANNTSDDVDFTWRVSGSDELGSGSVDANSVGYFTTSTGDKTVRLFVDDDLVDSAVSSGPCKEYLTLSFTCTDDGMLLWYARNPNDFGVDYTWTIDGAPGGRGMLPANSSLQLTTTTVDNHTIELVWTDTRPGEHTVRLSSTPESCDFPATVTPTNTLTAPPVEITLTPTPTNTLQAPPVEITLTPTASNTPQTPVVVTATNSPTAPVIVITNTPTNTQQPPVVITATNTPTNTQQPPVFITATNSPTVPFIVITNTPTNTPVVVTATSQPPIVVTATNVPTVPVRVITLTPTNTTQPPATEVAAPPVVITATNSPEPPFIVITNTPTSTDAAPPPVIVTPTLVTPQLQQIFTATATQIQTLAPPIPTTTRTPVLIPVTGGDSTNYGLTMRMSLLGSLLTNTGLVILGLALALTGIQKQLK